MYLTKTNPICVLKQLKPLDFSPPHRQPLAPEMQVSWVLVSHTCCLPSLSFWFTV